MKLSRHFTLAELIKSSTALRHGIDNTPGPFAECALRILAAEVLEPVRLHFGIPFSPSSGFRCRTLEKVICAKSIERFLDRHPNKTVEDYLDRKQHTKGEAADFEIPGISNLELHNWIKDNLDVDQNILEFYDGVDPNSGWCHVSFKKDNNRNMSFTIK